MSNYSQAKLYKIWSPSTEDIYIGSSCMEILARLKKHRAGYRSYNLGKSGFNTCYKIVKYPDHKIKLLRNVPCTDKQELLKLEAAEIRSTKCVNKVIPDRNYREWRKDNKEKFNAHQRAYFHKKKDIRKCLCGGTYNHNHKNNKLKHYNSIKHQKYISNFYNRLSAHLTQ